MQAETPIRPMIATSWQRAAQAGLRRDAQVAADIEDADKDSTLLRAAAPVVEDLASQLDGSDCALLLADRDQRIVRRHFSSSWIGKALDQVAAVPGAAYTEQASGTNAIATAFETGKGVFVLGEEHYLDQLQRFRCYGQPIRHPITGTLEGVLDITGLREGAEQLMRALVVTAARAIEGQLLLASPSGHVRLLSAYQAKAARSRHAVFGFGRDITLQNDAASGFVDEQLVQDLRIACADWAASGREPRVALRTPSIDGPAALRINEVDGSPGSFVLELFRDHAARPARGPRQSASPAVPPASGEHLLICGEPGSGRSTHGIQLCTGKPPLRVGPDLEPAGAAELLSSADHETTVLLENLDRFGDALADCVASAQRLRDFAMIATIASGDSRSIPPGLAGHFARRLEVPPLRHRRTELPQLIRDLLHDEYDQHGVTLAAIDQLVRYPWPGNFTELRSVLGEAVTAAAGLPVAVEHLPARVARASARQFTPLEMAEYRTIVRSLERHRGNKSRVAEELGIGRTTLYRRIRALGLPG